MKKGKFLILGLLAMVLALGLVLSGCETSGSNGSSDLDGIWHREGDYRIYRILTASNGNFTMSVDVNAASSPTRNYVDQYKGTYAKDAKSPVTMTVTSYNKNANSGYNGIDDWIAPEFTTVVATITDNELTITKLSGGTFV